MINSPLLSLRSIEWRLQQTGQEDNRLNKAAILGDWLIQMIAELRPAGSEANGRGPAWRFYNVLYYPYVLGISCKEALFELNRLQKNRKCGLYFEAPYEVA